VEIQICNHLNSNNSTQRNRSKLTHLTILTEDNIIDLTGSPSSTTSLSPLGDGPKPASKTSRVNTSKNTYTDDNITADTGSPFLENTSGGGLKPVLKNSGAPLSFFEKIATSTAAAIAESTTTDSVIAPVEFPAHPAEQKQVNIESDANVKMLSQGVLLKISIRKLLRLKKMKKNLNNPNSNLGHYQMLRIHQH
jgi:hypothetical protein